MKKTKTPEQQEPVEQLQTDESLEASPEAVPLELTEEERARLIQENEQKIKFLEEQLRAQEWKRDLESMENYYQDEAKPFLEAEQPDDAQRSEILAGIDAEREAAQRRVWPAQIDDLLAAGRKEEAEAKRAALQNLEDAIAARTRELDEITARRPGIEAGKKITARQVFERAAAESGEQIRELVSKCCDRIELARQTLGMFSDPTGLGLVP